MNPYFRLARLDQPIGIWLLLLPCWWSAALATPGWPNFLDSAVFALGAIVMRAAGCVINDIVDRDLDRKVTRTFKRPIAANEISVFQAMLFLAFLLALGLLVLIQFNRFTIWVGASSLFLVFLYPFMKRITFWPQAFLGLTFNWGALLGWASVRGDLGTTPIILYLAGFFWTIGYDTIYAHQDKTDDILIGVKSTALKFGAKTKLWLIFFYLLTTSLLIACGYREELKWPFFVGIFLGSIHLFWQVQTLEINSPKNCLKRFMSNRDFAFIILFSIIAAQIIP